LTFSQQQYDEQKSIAGPGEAVSGPVQGLARCLVVNIDTREAATRFRTARTGFAAFLFATLRPRHARAVTIDANALWLERGSGSSKVSLNHIESAEIETGWIWPRVRVRLNDGEAIVSGLSPDDSQAFIKALETARIRWWRRTLASQIEILHSVSNRLTQLEAPPAYQTRSAFTALRCEAQSAAESFNRCWPDVLSDIPEIRILKNILNFLEDPDHVRTKANAVFVANELVRSQEWFDRIEKYPLSEEQRKSVVIDEDRNLVIAAAGSGKTSVIVAKACWLLHRGYRRPPELLLLAFARDASKEMEKRINKQLGENAANGIAVNTFHSLGLSIIGKVEGRRPAIARAAEDERPLTRLLAQITEELAASTETSGTILAWFREQFAPYRSQHEFRTWGEYYDYIRRHEIRSLKGERVKSFEECEIANFLFLNGIHYEYERLYPHEPSTSEKGPYRPDFYLPDCDIWIEHFGINAEGKTAPYVPQKEYLQSMVWKKDLHERHGTTLIQTFSHEHAAGTLLRGLETKLRAGGAILSPISPAETFDILREQGRIDPFLRLVATFLQHFKGTQISHGQAMQRAAKMKDCARAEAFLAVFRLIYERYQTTLAQSGQIDFHDMIAKAAKYVETGRYRTPFGYILVDEFQDISPDQARLLKALLDSSPGTQLFAVGDDWQAIFRFTGSDIGFMREFSNYFGDSKPLCLGTTFRCADRIAAVSTAFILRNPLQVPKTVRSIHPANNPRVHIGLAGKQKHSLLIEALDKIAKNAAGYPGISTVLLLGRYKHLQPQNMPGLMRKYPDLRFSYKTVHGSKGLEADYVVVLGLCSSKYGFPTEITDDPLLNLVLVAPETHPNAEERRLLYVAITRARRHAFLLATGGPPSPFATELIGGGYDISVFGQPPEHSVSCPRCIEGRLTRRANKTNGSIFHGCSNYPYCEYRQRPCPACREGLPIKDREQFKCPDCGQSIAACPECDGWLETRMGKYGRFLGCTGFPVCRYTRKISFARAHSGSAAGTPRARK